MSELNENPDAITIKMAQEINQYIEEYYNETAAIKALMQKSEDEIVGGLSELLNRRQIIMEKYNILKQDYDSYIAGELSLNNNEMIKDPEESWRLQLAQLEAERNKLLESIRTIESENLTKINKLFTGVKGKVKHINDSRVLVNAYHGNHPLADGIYIDRRK